MKSLFIIGLLFITSFVNAQNYKVIGMGSKSNYFVFDATLTINDSFLISYHTLGDKTTETIYAIKSKTADTIVVTEKGKEFKVVINSSKGEFNEESYTYKIEWYYMEQLGLTYLCNVMTKD